MRYLVRILSNEEGGTVIEYGLIVALIAVAGLTVLQPVGGSLAGTMSYITSILTH